jgi:hypothetical protein
MSKAPQDASTHKAPRNGQQTKHKQQPRVEAGIGTSCKVKSGHRFSFKTNWPTKRNEVLFVLDQFEEGQEARKTTAPWRCTSHRCGNLSHCMGDPTAAVGAPAMLFVTPHSVRAERMKKTLLLSRGTLQCWHTQHNRPHHTLLPFPLAPCLPRAFVPPHNHARGAPVHVSAW